MTDNTPQRATADHLSEATANLQDPMDDLTEQIRTLTTHMSEVADHMDDFGRVEMRLKRVSIDDGTEVQAVASD